MTNFKVGDIVVSTIDSHPLRRGQEYIICEVSEGALEVSPVTSQHCDMRIIASACIFKPAKAESSDCLKSSNQEILLRRETNQVVASAGDLAGTATFTNEEEYERAAHVALSALFEQLRADNFNIQICIIEGDETFRPGQIYDIKKGKLVTRDGRVLPASGKFCSYKDVEDFFTQQNSSNEHWENHITYVIVAD